MTEQQKATAIAHAEKSLECRLEYRRELRRNSFAGWGNEKCISRLVDTLEAMEQGTASDRQWRYWEKH